MGLRIGVYGRVCVSVALIIFWAALQAQMGLAAAAGAPVAGKGESVDALYQKAKPEGRVVYTPPHRQVRSKLCFPLSRSAFRELRSIM